MQKGINTQWLCLPGNQAALRQFSHVPYFELKLPPPLRCACSEITARAQISQVLAISPRDMGCEMLRKQMLNLDFAFTERSSYSLLSEYHIGVNNKNKGYLNGKKKRTLTHAANNLQQWK